MTGVGAGDTLGGDTGGGTGAGDGGFCAGAGAI